MCTFLSSAPSCKIKYASRSHQQEKSWCQGLKWHMGVCTYPLSQGKLPLLLSVSKFSQTLNKSEDEGFHTRLRLGFTTLWLNSYRNVFFFPWAVLAPANTDLPPQSVLEHSKHCQLCDLRVFKDSVSTFPILLPHQPFSRPFPSHMFEGTVWQILWR